MRWEIPSEGVFEILPQVTLRRALTDADAMWPDPEWFKPRRKPLGSKKVSVGDLAQLIAKILRRNSIDAALAVNVPDRSDIGQQLLSGSQLNFVTC